MIIFKKKINSIIKFPKIFYSYFMKLILASKELQNIM